MSSSALVCFSILGLNHLGKRKPIPIIQIPGVKEAGWKPVLIESRKVRIRDRWVVATKDAIHTFAQNMLNDLLKLEESWPFKEPVDANEVPDYYDLVKNPIDLSKMQVRYLHNHTPFPRDQRFLQILVFFLIVVMSWVMQCQLFASCLLWVWVSVKSASLTMHLLSKW